MERSDQNLRLPISAVGITDINRLVREMTNLNEFLHQAEIRQSGTPMRLPKTSKLFNELAEGNGLNLLDTDERNRLDSFLKSIVEQAPRLHISFSVDPSPLFLQRLMDYLRGAIHPLVLVQVGLQPNIGAGCVIRSNNKVTDLSLREDFNKKRDLLMQYISKLQTPAEVSEETS